MRNSPTQKFGFTLVELLVAIAIASALTIVALPRVREGLQQNTASRAATLVKGVFENARANAIRTGRPYGVVLYRANNTVTPGDSINDPLLFATHGANYCNRLGFAQMAFDYRGDTSGATVTVNNVAALPAPFTRPDIQIFEASVADAGMLYAIASNQIPVDQQPITVGSIIRLGQRGTPGRIERMDALPSPAPARTRLYVRSGFPLLPGEAKFDSDGESFQYSIETRPVISPLAAIDLPGKVVIDLTCSGLSTSSVLLSPSGINQHPTRQAPLLADGVTRGYRDVIVMFNASGQLDGVYVEQYDPTAATSYVYRRQDPISPIAFLIGEIDAVVRSETIARYPPRGAATTWGSRYTASPYLPADFDFSGRKIPNFANPDASWLSINPSSGKTLLKPVATALGTVDEATAHPEIVGSHTLDTLVRDRLLDSRRLTRGASL